MEELNKKYETSILVSGDVLSEMVQALYLLRQVDVVQVKGRTTGTALYTVCGRKQYGIPQELGTRHSARPYYLTYALTHSYADAIAINIDSTSSGSGDAFPDANIISSHSSRRNVSPLSATYLEIVKLHDEGAAIDYI